MPIKVYQPMAVLFCFVSQRTDRVGRNIFVSLRQTHVLLLIQSLYFSDMVCKIFHGLLVGDLLCKTEISHGYTHV